MRVSGQAPRRRRRHVLRAARDPRGAARARRISPAAPSRISARCSTSSRWAPWPTSCASTGSTGRSSRRGSRASAPAARSPASRRCSPSPAAIRAGRRATTWASSPVRASMPRDGCPTWRSASAACSPTTEATAAPLAAELDRLNRERRDVESTMQEEALVALEARAVDAADADAYTLCLFHRGLAPGRRRHRRRAAQGSLPPPGHRVRARQRRRAQGIGPIDRRLPPARRARSRGQARAGAAREIRRPRVRRRPDARRGRPAAIRGDLRGDRPRAAVARAISRRTLESDGALAPGELGDRARRRAARPKSGARDSPRRCSTTRSPCSPSGSSAATTRSWRWPGATSASTRSCSAMRDPLPPSIRAAYRPDVNEWQRRGIAAARHRALAAGLSRARPPRRREARRRSRRNRNIPPGTRFRLGRHRVSALVDSLHATY